jgi:Ca-activated chloride channel family protein
LLIPEEKSVPPLAMVHHRVRIAMEDQVAVTRVEQSFRNHTDRQLEATYVFPVPKGASVTKFAMWIDGKEVKGEMLEADKARQIYSAIVRRTQDPGLLEYMGNNLLRMRVYPVEPKKDQKVEISYTSVSNKDAGVVEYIYPLKTDGKATATLEDFSINAVIKSQHPIQNVYSPTHAITLRTGQTTAGRANDREVQIEFEKKQGLLDKDFQLFYSTSDQDIGLTTLTHRPLSSEKGYFLLLIQPRIELPKDYAIPRDMVLVLDTSGSMRGPKMDQARRALKYCLDNLTDKDRFAVMNFASSVNRYRDSLLDSSKEQVDHAKKWVDTLEATGGTAIDAALAGALEMRTSDSSRTFTIVFFTDGMPTVGETNVDKIMKNVMTKNTANTRIFTFGVGDDVNATFLDQLAEQTRAVSTYVRPAEDIEAKVSSLYSKISHPVFANLQLSVGHRGIIYDPEKDLRFEEIYPAKLPDLFHGGQLVVLGRYSGHGVPSTEIVLSGTIGNEKKVFSYGTETAFAEKVDQGRDFIEHLWARRKVGYLLDQIRANGENKELVEETIALAKRYGIATPYTSYLIVPDAAVPVANAALKHAAAGQPLSLGRTGFGGGGGFSGRFGGDFGGDGSKSGGATAPAKVTDFAKQAQNKPGELASKRDQLESDRFGYLRQEAAKLPGFGKDNPVFEALSEAREKKGAYDQAKEALRRRQVTRVQTGKLGVDLSVDSNNLRNQSRLTQTALRNVAGRNVLEFGGVWIDEGFDANMPVVTVKAMSDAYFRIIERQPRMKEVFKLGNYLVWVAPNGSALVIDTSDGKEKMADDEIDSLFVAKK